MGEQLKIESPKELLELAIGYQKSQVLFTFVELEISKFLAAENLGAKDLAEKLKIHPLAVDRLLNACVAVGLLEKENEVYRNSHLTEKFLIKERDFFLGGQIKRYQNRSYPMWAELPEKLKSWKYGESNAETPEDEDQGAESMAEQHNLARLHGQALGQNFDFSNYKNLLDLGGGTGAMAIGLCETFLNLNATIFDLPENVKKADEFIFKANLQARIKTIGGDIIKDDLPNHFDVVLLANLLSVFDAATNKELFRRIYTMLPENGVCIISGWILDRNRLNPEISVLFCLEDICWNASDVERSFEVYESWLKDAGFKNINFQTYLEPTRLICAFK